VNALVPALREGKLAGRGNFGNRIKMFEVVRRDTKRKGQREKYVTYKRELPPCLRDSEKSNEIVEGGVQGRRDVPSGWNTKNKNRIQS
jgi:hypothetical protein